MSFAGDWDSSYLPSVNKTKRRILLFTVEEQKKINAARKMRGLPDLSTMMAGELGLSRAEPLVPPSELVTDDVNLANSDHRESSLVVAAAPKKKKSKKRAHDEPPVDDDRETLPEGGDRSEGAEPPTKKRKKKKRLSLEDSVTGRDSGIASPLLHLIRLTGPLSTWP